MKTHQQELAETTATVNARVEKVTESNINCDSVKANLSPCTRWATRQIEDKGRTVHFCGSHRKRTLDPIIIEEMQKNLPVVDIIL